MPLTENVGSTSRKFRCTSNIEPQHNYSHFHNFGFLNIYYHYYYYQFLAHPFLTITCTHGVKCEHLNTLCCEMQINTIFNVSFYINNVKQFLPVYHDWESNECKESYFMNLTFGFISNRITLITLINCDLFGSEVALLGFSAGRSCQFTNQNEGAHSNRVNDPHSDIINRKYNVQITDRTESFFLSCVPPPKYYFARQHSLQ